MKKEMITRKEFNKFKSNIDLWIRQTREEYSHIIDYGKIVEENVGNIQHNYELILELKDEIDNIKYSIALILSLLNKWVEEDEKSLIPRRN